MTMRAQYSHFSGPYASISRFTSSANTTYGYTGLDGIMTNNTSGSSNDNTTTNTTSASSGDSTSTNTTTSTNATPSANTTTPSISTGSAPPDPTDGPVPASDAAVSASDAAARANLTLIIAQSRQEFEEGRIRMPELDEKRRKLLSKFRQQSKKLFRSQNFLLQEPHLDTVIETLDEIDAVFQEMGFVAKLGLDLPMLATTELNVPFVHPVWEPDHETPRTWSMEEIENMSEMAQPRAMRENLRAMDRKRTLARRENKRLAFSVDDVDADIEFMLPCNLVTGLVMETAPKTYREINAATREQWYKVRDFYSLFWNNEDEIEDIRYMYKDFIGVRA